MGRATQPPLCGCGHEETQHLVNARDPKGPRGPCMHCHECKGFHPRGRGRQKVKDTSVPKEHGIAAAFRDVREALGRLERLVLPGIGMLKTPVVSETTLFASVRQPAPLHKSNGSSPRPLRDTSGLTKGEQRILTAVAQHREGVTKEQLTVLTGYKKSSRDTYMHALTSAGYVMRELDGANTRFFVSDRGRSALGSDFKPLPTGRALYEHWMAKLPQGERKILDIVASVFPHAIERDRITEATGYRKSSRDTYLHKLVARRLVERRGDGSVAASKELFS